MSNEAVVIESYNSDWPRFFEEEKKRLEAVFSGCLVSIEHIGSTAVAGLDAKPIIDIMLGVESFSVIEERLSALGDLAYVYMPQYEDEMPERRFFYKEIEGKRSHHLHAVEIDSDFWKRHLLFRDYLRTHPEALLEYANLKHKLAREFREDREAYTDAKSDFIERIQKLAGFEPLNGR